MVPPLKVRLVVPTPPTDPPQSLASKLLNVSLASVAARSSLKATAVADEL